MSHRLPAPHGERIDRNRPVRFRFEGQTYTGCAGDTLSSALYANGVRMLGRSFKYHRPRGVCSLANHDCNAMFQDGSRLNIRADITPLWEGAELTAVNTFGGLRGDWGRFLDYFSAFLPVGFYYKTFHTPLWLFPFWERQIRAAAGLGTIDPKHPRTRTPKDYGFCDVLVVGAGPAGLSAALEAANHGARVVVVDEQPVAGGSLAYRQTGESDAARVLSDTLPALKRHANVELRLSTVAAGFYGDKWIALVDERRMQKMRARTVIVASGCFELPAVFRHNDLPGVMLASAAQRLMRSFAVKPFERAVVLVANEDGYRAALDFHTAGIQVAAVIDLRQGGELTPIGAKVTQAKIPVHAGHAIYEAVPAGGKTGIRGVTVCPLDPKGEPRHAEAFQISCDGVAMSIGWAATDSLLCQAGAKMKYTERLNQFVPLTLPSGVFSAGRVNGFHALTAQVADGIRAGQAAAAHLGKYAGPLSAEPAAEVAPPSHPYPIFPHPKGKNFVDLDEDIQVKDIVHAAQEGFDHVELLKRYSTFGMGPSQGKLSNVNSVRILSKIRGQKMEEIGSPTARPFFHPVPFRHLAGRGFHPHRLTAMHGWHKAAGAQMLTAGEWLRPAYYASAGNSREQAIAEEVRSVRQSLGIIDVGTLGKLEISGTDAGEFIERIYTGRFANMKPGTTRYGLACDESGVIIDDGVVARFAEDRFYVTTTTTASGTIYREMQRWALIWGLNVVLVNATGTYGGMNLAGPRSREVLAAFTNVDVSEAAFPYLGVREGQVAGVPARLFRVGFVGELGYEIHVPSNLARKVWDALMAAGKAHQIRPFGVEAQRVLRLEKGHVIISQDTDGLTTPYEAHMSWAVKANKKFFIGQRSLAIISKKPLQRQLAGFKLDAGAAQAPKECHLVIKDGDIAGRVTSIVQSQTLQCTLGLAYVKPDQAKPGTQVQIRTDGGVMVSATVVEIPFYDPKNLKQKT